MNLEFKPLVRIFAGNKLMMAEIKQNSKSTKKYVVLGVLFILPIVAYLFFSSGVDNFLRLPILTERVSTLTNFESLDAKPLEFDDKISIVSFFGNRPDAMKGNALNLNEKIYERYHEFDDFQFVLFITEGAEDRAKLLLNRLDNYVNTDKWRFAVGSKKDIQAVFKSFGSSYSLDENTTSQYVFIVDKSLALRGRTDDEDMEDGILYGYNSANIAEVAKKLNDDVKVLLAEYRLALKKNSADRK